MNNQPMAINGYTIHSLLGKGGMAEVYLATQDSLRRKVAIKVLLSTDDDSFNQRFINEGHIVASLNHPAIITIYDINQLADGRYYLAMEFIGGGDLAQYKGQAFDPLRALAIIKQLAEGLAVIHERGLVHRDIKPANILFRHGDNVVITDFGIAKSLDVDSELTQHGMVVGSPAYSSPEQAQCQAIDQRTDIYSLGVILLEMLLGRNLYRGESYTQTVLNHVQMPVPALPPELSNYQPLLNKMLAKNPDDRFCDCRALLVELNRLLQQTVVVAPVDAMDQTRIGAAPVTPTVQAPRAFRRTHGMLAAAIALVLALAAAYPSIAKKIQIHGYLQQADQRLADQQLISPPTDNADYFYRQALALEPDNKAAIEGLHKVKAARISQLLALAEQHLANNQLLTPADDNAVNRFRQVLALQAAQPMAIQGLHRVATIYQGLAQDAHAQGKTTAALDYLASGLQVEPGNTALLKLQKDYAVADKPASNNTPPAGKKKSRKKPPSSLERFWHKLIGK